MSAATYSPEKTEVTFESNNSLKSRKNFIEKSLLKNYDSSIKLCPQNNAERNPIFSYYFPSHSCSLPEPEEVIKSSPLNSSIDNDGISSISTNSNNDQITSEENTYLNKSLMKEQSGSRLIQSVLKAENGFADTKLFPYFLSLQTSEIFDLICDPFGNYIFQSLLNFLSSEFHLTFVNMIVPNFFDISINQYGTRVIQKLIFTSSTSHSLELQNKLANLLKNNIDELLYYCHGNHIIQIFLKVFKERSLLDFIYDHLCLNDMTFMKIATDKFGCCTIQKSLSNANKQQKGKIMKVILKHIHQLLFNKYGNYIFQNIMCQENVEYKHELITEISPNLLQFCKTKHSSNAIEKCLEFNCQEINTIIMNIICVDENIIKELILDCYGNYIIQKALLVCSNLLYKKIAKVIYDNLHQIKQLSYGNKILSKLVKPRMI